MRRTPRRSLRASRPLPLLISLVTALSVLGIGAANPPPADAADPRADRCQTGLLREASPRLREECAAAQFEPGDVTAAVVPSGFQETVVWSGLVNPTAVRFAADGRVFVAEKSGVVKVFDNLTDPSPTVFDALMTNVHNYWDRGLLGLALDPSMTGGSGTGSFVYLLYTYDHILGSSASAPRWGDGCPTPPGPTTDGCVVSARLSRFQVSGSSITGSENVLIEDWCQQFPSHSIGSLVFGSDGALYVSSGDGASFGTVDHGQLGGTSGSPPVTPVNPCNDPPGGAMAAPAAEGGALRSQDVRTLGSASSSYTAEVAADAPVSHWRLGETGTTIATDGPGTNDGAYGGSYTQGVTGALVGDTDKAVTFGGGTGHIVVPDSASLDLGNGPWSVEFWAKRSDTGTYYQLIYSKGSQGNIFFFNNKLTVDDDRVTVATESGTTADSAWHHFVVTRAPGSTRIYKDGADVTATVSDSRIFSSNTSPLNIARYYATGTLTFNGSLDEMALYGQVLSPGRVAAHYAAGTAPQSGDPTGLDGTVLRVNPSTGAASTGNPLFSSSDPNARRIIAYGLRNPFRITTRPGTSEIWVADVGWNIWEEISRIANPTDTTADNFGWPCYEGAARQSGYDARDLTLCETLYAQGSSAVVAPVFAYNHSSTVVPGESCPAGSSSISGLAFYPESGGSFPAAYAGGLFFADYARKCIWFMPKGTNGQLNPSGVQTFSAAAGGPVDLVVGPGGDLFYPDFDGGTIRRVSAIGGNQPPAAVLDASPTAGPAPLTVQFDGTRSTDPEGGALTYAWDLDGDGAFDDATTAATSRTYQDVGTVTVGLRVTDPAGAIGTASRDISVGNDPPNPTITSPTSSLAWQVGDTIQFQGGATDPQDGTLPASALRWTVTMQHCPSNCHSHEIQTFDGVASGSFVAPDHEYPSYLELTLTATDSDGSTASQTVRLDPQTVQLTFATAPSGLEIGFNGATAPGPFTRTVIVGSSNSVSAPSPQTLNGATYAFASWSDGGGQNHQIVAPASSTTYTATFATSSVTFGPSADAYVRAKRANVNFGTATNLRVQANQYRSYLKFAVSGLSGTPSSAKLRLWVTAGSTTAGSVYLVGNTWTETGITWNTAPAIAGQQLSTVGTAPAGTWVEFDLGSAIAGNGTYSFAISGGSNDTVDYASRESANDPLLVVSP